MNNKNISKEEIISEQIHEIWCSIFNKISEVSKIDKDTKELIVPRFSTSRWLHQLDKEYNSLTEEEQYSDLRSAIQIINALEQNGYKIVKMEDI